MGNRLEVPATKTIRLSMSGLSGCCVANYAKPAVVKGHIKIIGNLFYERICEDTVCSQHKIYGGAQDQVVIIVEMVFKPFKRPIIPVLGFHTRAN